jgi:hypothetical protein
MIWGQSWVQVFLLKSVTTVTSHPRSPDRAGRERSKGEGPTRRSAGIRTSALAIGAISVHLGGATLLAVATGAVAVLTALSYFRGHETDPGLTTEVGLVITPLHSGLAMSDTLLAAALGATVAVIPAVKSARPPVREGRPHRHGGE